MGRCSGAIFLALARNTAPHRQSVSDFNRPIFQTSSFAFTSFPNAASMLAQFALGRPSISAFLSWHHAVRSSVRPLGLWGHPSRRLAKQPNASLLRNSSPPSIIFCSCHICVCGFGQGVSLLHNHPPHRSDAVAPRPSK